MNYFKSINGMSSFNLVPTVVELAPMFGVPEKEAEKLLYLYPSIPVSTGVFFCWLVICKLRLTKQHALVMLDVILNNNPGIEFKETKSPENSLSKSEVTVNMWNERFIPRGTDFYSVLGDLDNEGIYCLDCLGNLIHYRERSTNISIEEDLLLLEEEAKSILLNPDFIEEEEEEVPWDIEGTITEDFDEVEEELHEIGEYQGSHEDLSWDDNDIPF